MSTKSVQKIFRQVPLKVLIVAGILAFAGIGSLYVYNSRAAAPVASYEAEAGTASGNACTTSASGASGSQAVKFSATTCGGQSPGDVLTASKLTSVSDKRILFGHQSVGSNMVSGIPALYASYGLGPPNITTDISRINSTQGGLFAEFYVGNNTDPLGKITDFNTKLRTYNNNLDIAFMKFCFVDIVQGVNVNQIFTSYKNTMNSLAADFPTIKFVYFTAALDTYDTNNAVIREQLNSLIRTEYGATGRVFDLARIESTRPDGTRVMGNTSGNVYYQLYSGYSNDGGHLNATGQQLVNTALFALLATL